MLVSSPLFNIIAYYSHCNKASKRNKRHVDKKESKLSLFSNKLITFHIENSYLDLCNDKNLKVNIARSQYKSVCEELKLNYIASIPLKCIQYLKFNQRCARPGSVERHQCHGKARYC